MMDPYDKDQMLRILKVLVQAVESAPVKQECLTCVSHSQGFCKRFNDRIPADWLPKGCDGWIFDSKAPPF